MGCQDPKIKKTTIIGPKEKGELKMIDLKHMNKALKNVLGLTGLGLKRNS